MIGAPANAGATAPPRHRATAPPRHRDNVVLVAPDRFAATVGTAPVVRQIHLGFDHTRLPADPGAAATVITRRDNACRSPPPKGCWAEP